MPAVVRSRADACPGVFAPHAAADGALARVRLPGGVISAAALRAVAGCAEELGDGRVHLTSRGNLQLRGLARTPELVERLTAAALLPSSTHERVRNVLASPLSGIAGGVVDVRGLAAVLDQGLCARPALAGLPGRFLFALDGGRGDVAAEDPDLCWQATSRTAGVLSVAGVAVAAVALDDAVRVLLDAAEAFLALRAADDGSPWRAGELRDGPRRIGTALAAGSAPAADASRVAPLVLNASSGTLLAPLRTAELTAATPGPVVRDDGGFALVVAPLLGELTAPQARLLADAAGGPQHSDTRRAGHRSGSAPTDRPLDVPSGRFLVITPWRTVVLPDPVLPVAELAQAGLLVAPGPAARVSACAGRPGCAKALADVRADVRAALGHGSIAAGRVHVSGCARRCGAPRGAHVDVVATGEGYLVDGVPWPVP